MKICNLSWPSDESDGRASARWAGVACIRSTCSVCLRGRRSLASLAHSTPPQTEGMTMPPRTRVSISVDIIVSVSTLYNRDV